MTRNDEDPGIAGAARPLALTPDQVASPLAGRPYDLRHAAVSLWLNSGVSPPDVAERAGHGVDVLLRVYAKCLDGGEEVANKRIEAFFHQAFLFARGVVGREGRFFVQVPALPPLGEA